MFMRRLIAILIVFLSISFGECMDAIKMKDNDLNKISVIKVPVRDVFETYTNSCFYIDEKTKHGFLIDPGAEADKFLSIIKEKGWVIEKILLTHGHFDHTGAVEILNKTLKIPYVIHKNGELFLKDTHFNLSKYFKRNVVLTEAQYFNDGDIISLSSNSAIKLQVIHTPGHTPDSVVFYDENNKIAFVGDTIFKKGIGNAGYPGGNAIELQNSIINKVFTLPADTILYTGHSEETTVGEESSRYRK